MTVTSADVGRIVRMPDDRTAVLVLVRGTTATVRLPSGQVLLYAPGQLKAVGA